ncbi:MAG: MaoC family dehydratase [Cohaesibacter sp.]|nr:MaoC family dehydratase [Cohaesibacter sp.]
MLHKGRILPPALYRYDDLHIDDVIRTAQQIVTTKHIDNFAELTGDYFAIHMDRKAAHAKGFPDRVAHGLLVLSLVDGLKNQAEARLDAIASLGWTWHFQKPVFAGDSLQVMLRVSQKRSTGKDDRGIVTFEGLVWNQHDVCVQSGTNELMMVR